LSHSAIENNPSIILSSTIILKLFLDEKTPKNWIFFYDIEVFKPSTYIPQLGEYALNEGCEFHKLSEVLNTIWTQPVFVKPNNDLKLFPGIIIPCGTSLQSNLSNITIAEYHTEADVVLVSQNLNHIDSEYRCFIIDGKIIFVGSGRQKNGTYKYAYDREAKNFCKIVKKIYEPTHTYVLNIARLKNGEFKVVKFSCLQCSRMNDADKSEIIEPLKNLAVKQHKTGRKCQ
jgi:hypothetical protein